MTEFTLPELGENVEAGDVMRVLVAVGDSISRDQPVLELETDKATLEVPSSVEGKVTEIKVKAGQKVKVGDVILTVEAGDAPKAGTKAGPSEKAAGAKGSTTGARSKAASKTAATEAEPTEEEADTEGDSTEAAGAAEDGPTKAAAPTGKTPAADTEGSPAETPTADEPSESDEPEEAQQRPRRGEVVDISRGARPSPAADAATGKPATAAAAPPSVRRLAREIGVEINEVGGTGPGGRITIEDVKAYAKKLLSGQEGAAPAAAAEPLPDFSKWGEVEIQPMRSVRRTTARRLANAWAQIPHVTQHERADVTDLDRMRERFAPEVEAAGGKLTVTAILLKVVASALKTFPQVNASVDVANASMVLKKYVHMGVAVDTDNGLLVPVIRDVDRKNMTQLSVELAQVAERAKARKLSRDEMEGGCFTITNLGGFGGTGFSPIVNWPEVAILGVSRARTEPVYIDGQLQPRLMMPLSLSYDHRAIDGADAIRFVRWIVDALEQPFLLALQG